MDKQQAQKIIKETFERPFNKDRFIKFVKNLLNRIDDAPFTYQGNYIPEKFRQYIRSLERIGKFSDGENSLDILIITLQKETSLERARTMQRNFIAWYLNGSRGGEMKDAALVAYVSPDSEDWRFSLVKMDYKFEKTKTGKVKVKEEFTPARRWSFLVGVSEKSHTAQSRLVKILANDEQNPTLAELEEAFNIETVTKEFFLKYRELFIRTKKALDRVVQTDPKVTADFEAKGVDTVNFSKKLLGQIVFLYFLQKKGWFGVGKDDDWGTGSKDFLRKLFEGKYGNYGNFFNDILEPLFYEALRIDRSHDDDYYSRFNCKIPFLNGGLFDPIGNYDWVHTDIHLPDDLFSNSRKTKEGDTGDGILDVFDRYNFTVREDEPLEKEVAIDPELLGKAYEKFNAIRPDNFDEYIIALKSGKKGAENKFNKKFGVYYTPRGIVHYMCQQSLINYLHTKVTQASQPETKVTQASQPETKVTQASQPETKVTQACPPEHKVAQASKPKPLNITRQDIENLIEVGELITEHEATALLKQEKIKNGIQKSTEYTALLSDSIRKNAAAIDKWLEDITVCDPAVGSGAFPVGMMNEIVRTRNVLSVFLQGNTGIPACDNTQKEMPLQRSDYEFKRRCIEHSLYGVDIDPGAVEIAKLRLWLSLVVDEEDIKNIRPLPNLDYRIMQGNSLISEFMGINFDAEPRTENSMFKDETAELIEQLQQKKDAFLNESNVTKKARLKEEVEDLLVEIFETKLRTQKADYFNRLKDIENKYAVLPNKAQREELIKQEKGKLYKESGFDLETAEKQLKEFTSGRQVKPFFLWNLYFSEVFHEKGGPARSSASGGGFDVVIANPPYGNIFTKKEKASLRKSFIELQFKIDAYSVFLIKGISLNKENGYLIYIIPSTFMDNYFEKNVRKNLLVRNSIEILIELDDSIFESAVVHSMIIGVIKQYPGKEHNVRVGYSIDLNFEKQDIPNEYFLKQEYASFSIRTYQHVDLLSKLKKDAVKLEKVIDIRQAIKSGNDKKYIHRKKINNSYKPIVGGKHIKKWLLDAPGLYIFYGGHLACPRDPKIFEQPKILIREAGKEITATYDGSGYYVMSSLYNAILINDKFSLVST
ncbi:MAG TPA: class I SAM-dependent DNA methyltransferase [Mariniphaga anaerophila]|uniref:site-specific DNA-methyltransferase (adenine-specific) n=1 Tax=Mariniphaga anaerophila TaxID=1484053 RepID=A0A831LGI3_9BACT|nr:class I SAM-dependent DNA methyltransferase [Mariniphaga anaerophila]